MKWNEENVEKRRNKWWQMKLRWRKDKKKKWKEGKLEGGGGEELFISLFGFLVFVVRTNEIARTQKGKKMKNLNKMENANEK